MVAVYLFASLKGMIVVCADDFFNLDFNVSHLFL